MNFTSDNYCGVKFTPKFLYRGEFHPRKILRGEIHPTHFLRGVKFTPNFNGMNFTPRKKMGGVKFTPVLFLGWISPQKKDLGWNSPRNVFLGWNSPRYKNSGVNFTPQYFSGVKFTSVKIFRGEFHPGTRNFSGVKIVEIRHAARILYVKKSPAKRFLDVSVECDAS